MTPQVIESLFMVLSALVIPLHGGIFIRCCQGTLPKLLDRPTMLSRSARSCGSSSTTATLTGSPRDWQQSVHFQKSSGRAFVSALYQSSPLTHRLHSWIVLGMPRQAASRLGGRHLSCGEPRRPTGTDLPGRCRPSAV